MSLQLPVITYMASQLASKEERQKMNEIFKALDKNHDGILSKEELIAGFSQVYATAERAVLEVEVMLSKLDLNGTG